SRSRSSMVRAGKETEMRVYLIAVLLVACNAKENKPASVESKTQPPPPAAGSAEAKPPTGSAAGSAAGSATSPECATRADKIATRVKELTTKVPGFMPRITGLEAPESKSGKPIDARGFVIAITKDGKFAVEGTVMPTSKDVSAYLDSMWKSALEKWAMDGHSSADSHFPIYIWADKNAQAGKIGDLEET